MEIEEFENPQGETPAVTENEISGNTVNNEESVTSEELTPTQKRINQLTRERREAVEEAARLRGQVEALTMMNQNQPVSTSSNEESVEPKVTFVRENYDSDEEQIDAIVQHVTKEVTKSVQTGQQTRNMQEQYNVRHSQIMKEVEEIPELMTMVQDPTLRMTEVMLEAADGPMFAKIYHHLGKNRSDFLRIMALPPSQQAKEIGKIESLLSIKPKPKTDSGAPEPSSGIVPGSGTPTDVTDPDKKSQKENFAQWEQDRRKKLTGSPQ